MKKRFNKKRAGLAGAVLAVGLAGAGTLYWKTSGNDNTSPSNEPAAKPKDGAAAYSLTVDGTKTGVQISPSLYGVFFEEINHAGDGGLYAELIANRSFEDNAKSADKWSAVTRGGAKGSLAVTDQDLMNPAQGHALTLKAEDVPEGGMVGAANSGYWGIHVDKGAKYNLSFYAKRGADFGGPLTVRLETGDGKTVLAESTVQELGDGWQQVKLELTASDTASNAQLVVYASHKGTVNLDLVSLFPETWNNRENGLRKDLAEKVNAIAPKFLRFPGGCFIEGSKPENAYRWKNTIGPVAERPGHQGYWNYKSTDGLGFHEFLQWAEDMKAEPLYVAYIGISHDGDPFAKANYVPLTDIQPWIQDALDAIEYANGPVTSTWGAKRAANGHPEPFNLKYIEIGNENNFQMAEYIKRYPLFYKAIKEKYPDIQLIANGVVPGQKTEILDEHYYESTQWFLDNSTRYDTYDRNGPKIYVGEYAVTKGAGEGNMNAALGEAAFMTGMERNSDIVRMSSYAPLFVHAKDRTWNPDAIVFNSDASFGTPSYYVQKMFGSNMGSMVVPSTVKAVGEEKKAPPISGSVGVGTWSTQVEYDDVKVVQGGKTLLSDDFANVSGSWKTSKGSWTTKDGVFKQSSGDSDVRAVAGDAAWNNYTLTLRARKTGGNEGMLVLFGVKDSNNYYWLNLGGWNNTSTAIEKATAGAKATIGKATPMKIETGKWYDIKIELQGTLIKAYVDGKLIQEVNDQPNMGPLFQVAAKDEKSGDLILKVVNVSDTAEKTEISLNGLTVPKGEGTATVMKAGSPNDQNSFSNPEKVAPATSVFPVEGGKVVYEFPQYSVSVLRIKTK